MNKYDYIKLCPFKWFVLENFPFIEDDFDALTNWQLFCKLGKEINRIIKSQNTLGSEMETVVNAFIELQNYIDNYFDNLDVQEEINNKLDEMVENGTLQNIIKTYLDSEFEEQNIKINNIENMVQSVANGSPYAVDSLDDMTDTSRTYVLTTTGKWYYYNGTEWTMGGTYQSSGIGLNSIYVDNLESPMKSCFKGQMTKITPNWNVGGYYKKTDGTLASQDTGCYTAKINVTPGDRYLFVAKSNYNNFAPVVFFDNSNNFVGYVDKDAVYDGFVVPSNATKMALSTQTTESFYERCYYKITNYVINGQNHINYGDLDDAFQNSFELNYEEITDLSYDSGFWHKNNPNYHSAPNDTSFKCTQIMVTPGDRYRISGTSTGNVSLIQLIGQDDPIVYPDASVSAVTDTSDYELTIPNGYYVMNISGFASGHIPIKVEKVSSYTFSGIDSNSSYDIQSLQEFNINEQLKNDFKWKNSISNGKYATFTFDDTLADISTILALFKSKNVPVCFATIPNKLDTTCADGRLAREVLTDCEEHGGEVLAHWGSPLTSSSTDNDYYNVYHNARKILKEAGFDVNGIITAGGTNYQTQDFDKDVELARNNFLYADLTGYNDHNIEQYWNRRNFLDDGVTAIKSLIDNYISGTNTQPYSKWLNFASHGTNTTSIEDLETIIDYCIANNIQIVTWKYLYDTFRSSALENRIETLELS